MFKSLKIVDSRIYDLKSKIAVYDDLENPSNFALKLKKTEQEKLLVVQQIKGDLEVLKIIIKKKVNVQYLIYAIKHKNNNDDMLQYYNSIMKKCYKLSMMEFLKITRFLENNELVFVYDI